MTLNQTSTGNYRVHGLLCSGGTIGLSGGTLTVSSAGSGDTIGAAVSFGSLALQGGTLNAISTSGGPATGLYMKEGTATVNGTSLSVTAKNGTIIGIDKPGLGATVTIAKGQMTLDGGNVTVGKGASTGSTIQITGSIEDFPVSVTYTTGYSIGNFWSKTPKVETK